MNKSQSHVYLMSNKMNTVIYTGVTSDLIKRVYEHKQKLADGFTKKYNATKLIYYETFDSIRDAIVREKQIKGWIRKKKVDLVAVLNPQWKDLYDDII